MSSFSSLRFRVGRFVFEKMPRTRKLVALLSESIVRLVLSPQVTVPPPAGTHDPEDVAARTDSLNEAAEAYFVDSPLREYLTTKPYSDPVRFPEYLFNMGVLFHGLRVGPGDTVVELGAGTSWVSHFLNLYGCRTISIDVSRTALEWGRELFERDRRTRWDLKPKFLSYDGHRLPLDDESCDRIVIHDAFHHIPNQEEILREMARILRTGGIVAMNEPGRLHSLGADSQREMAESGVLENDIVVERLSGLAQSSGFSRVTLMPVHLKSTVEIPADELEAFLKGKGFHQYWSRLCRGALLNHRILMYKGDYVRTTRRPGLLRAEIDLLSPVRESSLTVASGQPATLRCRIRNQGNTLWLAEPSPGTGRARLGAHLHTSGDSVDWYRASLPNDIEPGGEAFLDLELPPVEECGTYRVVFDMVAKDITWFAQQGSKTTELELVVE